MSEPIPDSLKNLQQRLPATLPQVPGLIARLRSWQVRDPLLAISMDGSFARGGADKFSDVDVHADTSLAVDEVRECLGDGLVDAALSAAGERPRFEAVFSDGVIYDIVLETAKGANNFARRSIEGRYWISVLKSRKLVYRGQLFVAQRGLSYQRGLVLQVLAQAAGQTLDAPHELNIHALRQLQGVIEAVASNQLKGVFGAPCRDLDEFCAAVDAMNEVIISQSETAMEPLLNVALTCWQKGDFRARSR